MSNQVAPLLIILILVGGIAAWGYMTDWTFSGLLPRKGARCIPKEDTGDVNAKEYIYNADEECLIVNKCKKGWEPNSSNTACTYSADGTVCTPTGAAVTNGKYTFDDAGTCVLSGCSGNFKLPACDTCETGYMLKDGKCVDPGLTISDEKIATHAEPKYDGVKYLDRYEPKCENGALNQFKFTGETGNYKYTYKCIEDIPGFSLGTAKTTSKVVTANNKKTSYLTDDKMDVDCEDSPISNFKLNRPDGGAGKSIAYKYTCATNKVNSSTCKSKQSTGLSDVADIKAILNNEVKCDGKGVITQFKLAKEEGDKGKYYYDYECCDMY
ncbi:hypothetical protein N9095_00110 [bacterium]|nr:hypothetical protein [bacterium]